MRRDLVASGVSTSGESETHTPVADRWAIAGVCGSTTRRRLDRRQLDAVATGQRIGLVAGGISTTGTTVPPGPPGRRKARWPAWPGSASTSSTRWPPASWSAWWPAAHAPPAAPRRSAHRVDAVHAGRRGPARPAPARRGGHRPAGRPGGRRHTHHQLRRAAAPTGSPQCTLAGAARLDQHQLDAVATGQQLGLAPGPRPAGHPPGAVAWCGPARWPGAVAWVRRSSALALNPPSGEVAPRT